jgi:hypothetical protein
MVVEGRTERPFINVLRGTNVRRANSCFAAAIPGFSKDQGIHA